MNPWADQPYYSYTPPYEVTKYNLTYTKRIFAELNSGLDHMGDPSMLSHPSMSPQLPLEQELRFNDKLNYVQKLDVPNYIFFQLDFLGFLFCLMSIVIDFLCSVL